MEKKDLEKILKYLDVSLLSEFSLDKVRDLAQQNLRYVGADLEISEDCYNLSITDVLRFYKIEILIKYGIVSQEEGKKIADIYFRYLNIQSKIGEEAYKNLKDDSNSREKLDVLHNESNEVSAILNKFHILDSDTDYTRILEVYYLSKFETELIQRSMDCYSKLAQQESEELDNAIYTLKKYSDDKNKK